MKNRWIALYVENQVGVLAKVSDLFSGKSYNLQSLTVGTTEDETVSRMTICVTSDDITFEQIKKQLNRMVEVIKVIDLTDVPIHMKEILFAKVLNLNAAQIEEVFQIAQVFQVQVADIGNDSVLLECKLTERLIQSFGSGFISIQIRLFKNAISFSKCIGVPCISCTFRRFSSLKPTRILWFASAR